MSVEKMHAVAALVVVEVEVVHIADVKGIYPPAEYQMKMYQDL